jgi:hypothetical protein
MTCSATPNHIGAKMDAGPHARVAACLAVTLHQRGVAHHIGSKNGSKLAIHDGVL